MSYYELPKHGDKTTDGAWTDNRPITPESTWGDLLDSVHTPDCDVLGCSYRWIDHDGTGTRIELTYHGGDGLWMCPTHWAEFYTYEPPRLTTYGESMTGAKG